MRRADHGDTGVALVLAMMTTLLLTALAAALILTTSAESLLAGNFLASRDAVYAADAALERALVDLANTADWNRVLAGEERSRFVDGPPGGRRSLPGVAVDLAAEARRATCGRSSACSDAEVSATSAARPWGADNPRWQLYAYGSLEAMLSMDGVRWPGYVVVLVGDDPAERDGEPLRDSPAGQPGSGLVALRAEVFGGRGLRHAVEATVARTPAGGVAVRSWRDLR